MVRNFFLVTDSIQDSESAIPGKIFIFTQNKIFSLDAQKEIRKFWETNIPDPVQRDSVVKILANNFTNPIFRPYIFSYKHGAIFDRVEYLRIIKHSERFFLEISVYMNQNTNLKCLRFDLLGRKKFSEWDLVSSFGKSTKIYSGNIKF